MSTPILTPRTLVLAISLSLLGGCGAPEQATAPAAAPVVSTAPVVVAEPAKPTLGSFGFDTAGMDRSVNPGDDFYAFANGNWVKSTEIPADRSRYNSFAVLTEKALTRTRAILDEASKPEASGDARKIGDYYSAFMDEDAIEARGVAPIQPELDAIAALADHASLSAKLGSLVRADVDLMNSTDYYTDRLFGVWISQHLDRPTENSVYLVQGGLGLPDRDFYLEGGRFEQIRDAYLKHIASVLALANTEDPTNKAKGILALETAIAKVHASQLDTNDIKKGANYWPRSEFAAKAPGLDWEQFFAGAMLGSQPELIVWQPGAVSGISALTKSVPLDTWKDYLRFHALDRASPFLPKAFADGNFAFYGTTLNGTPQQQDRWKRGVAAVNQGLGEAVGKLYVERHFTAETKARADAMVANLIAAFGKRIDALAWMSDTTKARARAKLAGLEVGMGYPARWRDYSALDVRKDDPLGNHERAELFEYQRNVAKLGAPVDRGEWFLLPHTVNALNIPLENRLLFPAAILEAPFFDAAADDAINYGGIGGVIGHEITHSFDSGGALFDETGRLSNWWTPEDLAKFEAAGATLATQYDQYQAFPDLNLNGKLTLGENIADVAGLATAFDAYMLSQAGKEPVVLEGFTPEQRVFLGWAQVWRSKFREPSLRNAVLTGVHSPGEFRAATVRNQDAWYTAFDIKPENARYLAPEARVKVW